MNTNESHYIDRMMITSRLSAAAERLPAPWARPRPAEPPADVDLAGLRHAVAAGLGTDRSLAEIAQALDCGEGWLVAAHAGIFDPTESPLKARRLCQPAGAWLEAAVALPWRAEVATPGLTLAARRGRFELQPTAVAQAFAVEWGGPAPGRQLMAFDAAARPLLALAPDSDAVLPAYQALVAGCASARLEAGWGAPAVTPAPAPVPLGQRLPEGALWELLVRVVQIGLPLRLEAGPPAARLQREGPLDRLEFDGPWLRAAAGADSLAIDESRCDGAWCQATPSRSGLRHVIEVADADGRAWLRIADATQPPRTESCTWRELVQSLLPRGGLAC